MAQPPEPGTGMEGDQPAPPGGAGSRALLSGPDPQALLEAPPVPTVLETERLVLRPLEESDWPVLQELGSDPEMQRYLGGHTGTEEEARAYLREIAAEAAAPVRLRHGFAIVLKGEGRVAGICLLSNVQPELRQAELGYALARRYWGMGYTTEAVRALLSHAFQGLGLRRVWGQCNVENLGSWRVLEKLAMRREGRLVESTWWNGRWCDVFLYAILDREWRALSAR